MMTLRCTCIHRCFLFFFGAFLLGVTVWLAARLRGKVALHWRHNDHGGVSNHQPHDCLLNRLFRRRSKKTSKLCVTGLCAGNSPLTGEFPAQRASYAENVSIWWRHHGFDAMAISMWMTSATSVTNLLRDDYIHTFSFIKIINTDSHGWHMTDILQHITVTS